MSIAMLTKKVYNIFRYSFKVGRSYSSPSITVAGAAGILLMRMAVLPFMSSSVELKAECMVFEVLWPLTDARISWHGARSGVETSLETEA